MAWTQLTELGGYTLATTDLIYTNLSTGYAETGGNHLTVGNTPVSVSNFVYGQTAEKNLSWTLNENANCTNHVWTQGSGVSVSGYFNYRGTDSIWRSRGFGSGGGGSSGISNVNYTDFVFFINDELQEADVIYFRYMQRVTTTGYCGRETSQTLRQYIYQILKSLIPPEYNWQSVPSISGKNGILQSLVQIKEEALNDGEPVSEATVLSFDSLGNINIPSVIDEQMPVDPSNPTSVTITYLIPVLEYGSYSYIKLAIKKNNIPLSIEDADKVVDLDEPTTITRIGSATVSGLDELSHYYFVIFIEDNQGNTASSEPKDCVTGEIQEVTLADIAKTLNTDYMQLYVNNQWWYSYQNAFAQYLGTNNILQAVRNGGSRIALYDGENLNTNDKWGVSESRIWIPIQRLTVSKITVTGYTTYQGNYRYGYIQLCKIESGALVETGHIIQLPWQGSQDSKTVSYEFETPFEADYISLEAGDGVIYLHDIIFNGE